MCHQNDENEKNNRKKFIYTDAVMRVCMFFGLWSLVNSFNFCMNLATMRKKYLYCVVREKEAFQADKDEQRGWEKNSKKNNSQSTNQ